jgi:hypothetical protein
MALHKVKISFHIDAYTGLFIPHIHYTDLCFVVVNIILKYLIQHFTVYLIIHYFDVPMVYSFLVIPRFPKSMMIRSLVLRF